MKRYLNRHSKFKRNFAFLLIIAACGLTGCKSTRHAMPAVSKHTSSFSNNTRLSEHLNSDSKLNLIDEAKQWLGTPYGYGRAERGVATDCSGMVMNVVESCWGIKMPRTSAQQADFCRPITRRELREGDLAFFATGQDSTRISHVGIMIDQTQFIHASSSKGVVISKLDSPYYTRTLRRLGRIPR